MTIRFATLSALLALSLAALPGCGGGDSANSETDSASGGNGGGGGQGGGGNGGDTEGAQAIGGVSATLGGTVYTFTQNVSWLPIGTTNSPLDASGAASASWSLRKLTPTVGQYACADGGAFITLRANQNNYYTTDAPGGSCSIEVLAVGPNALRGRFSGTFVDGNNQTYTVTDGYFWVGADNAPATP